MSSGYQNNHYVPQWYQRRFIPAESKDRELFLLDLKPERFKTPSGKKITRKALRKTGTRRCFAIDDLYTMRIGGVESRELEKKFFGEVDRRGQRAVDWFASDGWDGMYEEVLNDFMMFMSTQKIRTAKGLDWLLQRAGGRRREDILAALAELRTLYGAVWAECVWQIVDASDSPTKFVISDHPVTVFNDPFDMTPDEIAKWLGGGAEPGSTKHEHAKAALEWRVAQLQADASAGRAWARAAAVAAVVAALAAVASAVAAVTG